ncbi:MAG: restriction endonuclease subunit S [Succiniclasticum sp.]|uniref:restriction endonuclease subunit S n=1 Tax=Succiniclasticum sp. TaxID=2775030 RepID=UPI002A917E8C|nr:restriction endonuclease subunit S [Succiniclasticum sp.]MDY6290752.1 restriction endonuclease subunit S [Succiniclasticum sp.]
MIKTTIEQQCTVTSSKRVHLSERTNSGVPFYCSKEIIEKVNGTMPTETDFISEEQYINIKDKFGVPQPDDLLLTTRGTIGVPYLYRNNDKFYFADGNLTWLKDFKSTLSSKYLYYWFQTKEARKSLEAISKGTAQQALSIEGLKKLSVRIPDIKVQNRVCEIISSYDDLIENNQKQIKLLEEAAQRLYKEWFVDLRFPGYEQTKIVDGVPEGWEKGSLEQIGFFKRGKTITSADLKDGVVPVIAGGIEPAYYHNKANTVAPVVTVSGSGANAGYTSLHHVDVFASDCSYADNLATPYVYFIYCFLKANKACLNNLQKGAAQPHVYAKDINIMNIIVPTNIVLDSFTEAASLYFIKIKNIKQQITLLAEARDRLLPKLMNGEIEV